MPPDEQQNLHLQMSQLSQIINTIRPWPNTYCNNVNLVPAKQQASNILITVGSSEESESLVSGLEAHTNTEAVLMSSSFQAENVLLSVKFQTAHLSARRLCLVTAGAELTPHSSLSEEVRLDRLSFFVCLLWDTTKTDVSHKDALFLLWHDLWWGGFPPIFCTIFIVFPFFLLFSL